MKLALQRVVFSPVIVLLWLTSKVVNLFPDDQMDNLPRPKDDGDPLD